MRRCSWWVKIPLSHSTNALKTVFQPLAWSRCHLAAVRNHATAPAYGQRRTLWDKGCFSQSAVFPPCPPTSSAKCAPKYIGGGTQQKFSPKSRQKREKLNKNQSLFYSHHGRSGSCRQCATKWSVNFSHLPIVKKNMILTFLWSLPSLPQGHFPMTFPTSLPLLGLLEFAPSTVQYFSSHDKLLRFNTNTRKAPMHLPECIHVTSISFILSYILFFQK